MHNLINNILSDMDGHLSIEQTKYLIEVLTKRLTEGEVSGNDISNDEYLDLFLSAKQVEGCSKRTISYYQSTLMYMLEMVNISVMKISTENIRKYLKDYQARNNCSKVTLDNVRRILSSFFAWLEEENYILRNPVRRIHKVKVRKTVKDVISDEKIEIIRDGCETLRDLAMIDMLFSTGIRVGELVNLDISDIDFEERECVVYGKGDKERKVYFDAKTKLHLQKYIGERTDKNSALFVTLNYPYKRLQINGVEVRLREMGRRLGIDKVHPHKFRRTMATRAIDKGMPIEQVQQLLGHQQIDTTMRYAMVNQVNVKNSHKKFIS